jgi:hypothetical protein
LVPVSNRAARCPRRIRHRRAGSDRRELGSRHRSARCAARSVCIVRPGESAKAILDLPIAVRCLPKDMIGALRVLGFERVSELVSKPRAPPTLRFGPELGRRLDQALGRLSEPIVPVPLPTSWRPAAVSLSQLGPRTVVGATADQDMDMMIVGVPMIDADLVELRSEFPLGIRHQLPSEGADVLHVGGVFRRDDESEMMPIILATFSEGLRIGIVRG